MLKIALIAGFGATGGLSRYGIDSPGAEISADNVPWNTLIVKRKTRNTPASGGRRREGGKRREPETSHEPGST